MARFALLTGTPRGAGEPRPDGSPTLRPPVVIVPPSGRVDDVRQEFKAACRMPENAEFSEVQLWTSDAGITGRHKFRDPSAPAIVQEEPQEPQAPKTPKEPKAPKVPKANQAAAAKDAPKPQAAEVEQKPAEQTQAPEQQPEQQQEAPAEK